MLPINNIQFVSLNNKATQVSFNQLLIYQWEEWAKNRNSGEGEQRGCAIYRLMDCLEREACTALMGERRCYTQKSLGSNA